MEAILPAKSLVDRTYEALLDAICTGEFRPGDRVVCIISGGNIGAPALVPMMARHSA